MTIHDPRNGLWIDEVKNYFVFSLSISTNKVNLRHLFIYDLYFTYFLTILKTFKFLGTVSELNQFKPRPKSPKNRFQLSAGLNL